MPFQLLLFLFSLVEKSHCHKIMIVGLSFFKNPTQFSPTLFQTSQWLDIEFCISLADETYATKYMATLIFTMFFCSFIGK